MDYGTTKFCPIDNNKMFATEDDSDEKIYSCDVCGLEVWRYNTSEQTEKEARKYFESLSKKDRLEIEKKVLNKFSELPDDKTLLLETRKFYHYKIIERDKKKEGLKKGLRALENWAKSF